MTHGLDPIAEPERSGTAVRVVVVPAPEVGQARKRLFHVGDAELVNERRDNVGLSAGGGKSWGQTTF